MKKIGLIIILILILATSLVKNSTKEIEDKIFALRENIRSLKIEFSDEMLEFNFCSISFYIIKKLKTNTKASNIIS